MKDPETTCRSRFWRHFDRWALLAIIGLLSLVLAMRWSTRRVSDSVVASESGEGSGKRMAVNSQAGRTSRATPVFFGNAPHRSPVSVESAVSGSAWGSLRELPALDVRETEHGFELRLSVPPPNGTNARAYVVGRRVDIEVPLKNPAGTPTGRLFRQVLLPTAPSPDHDPRLEHADGILRVHLVKP